MARTGKESNHTRSSKHCSPKDSRGHCSPKDSRGSGSKGDSRSTCPFGVALPSMVLLAATTGLRRSELFALKWDDIDFSNATLNVSRAIYNQVVGNCKTEGSSRPLPLDQSIAKTLWSWKEQSDYSKPDDWVFASPRKFGKMPYWPAILLRRIVRPAAIRAGITKWIGWAYLSTLVCNIADR